MRPFHGTSFCLTVPRRPIWRGAASLVWLAVNVAWTTPFTDWLLPPATPFWNRAEPMRTFPGVNSSGEAGAGPEPVVAPSCGSSPASDRSQLGPAAFSLPHTAPVVACALGAFVAYTVKTDHLGLFSRVTICFVSNQSVPLVP